MPTKSGQSKARGRSRNSQPSPRSGPLPKEQRVGVLDRPLLSDLHGSDLSSPKTGDFATINGNGRPGHRSEVNGTPNGAAVINGAGASAANGSGGLIEAPAAPLWQTGEIRLTGAHLGPSAGQSIPGMDARRSRSGIWTTMALVMLAAALTVALLTWMGGADQNHADAQAAVEAAAERAGAAVTDSVSSLQSLRAESSFTPELVASISALGEASRALVESVTALPSDNSFLVELRMQATGLAGRVSRLGETFGAAFSYRGQVAPLMNLPALEDPLNIAKLPDNASVLTDWQFQLEQAASTEPSHPRLVRNHETLSAMLPYIAVHRQAYAEAVGDGQPEQATAALSQIGSLLSALRQDFDRAYREIAETADAEIGSLSADLGVLARGTSRT